MAGGTDGRNSLTEHGREFCFRPNRFPNGLFWQLGQKEPRFSPIRSPMGNGFVERFREALLEKHSGIEGCNMRCEILKEIQMDLAREHSKQTHQGLNTKGRTPDQADYP